MAVNNVLILALLVTAAAAQGNFMPEFNDSTINTTTSTSTPIANANASDVAIISDIENVASVCAQSFLAAIPSTFCWKLPIDLGKAPEGCAPGLSRYFAVCYEDCDSDYSFSAGACREVCPAGYKNEGLICGKDSQHWFWRKAYIPKAYNNFSSKSLCSSGFYKTGGLCFTDCTTIGLVNCGTGACAANAAGCEAGVLTIALEAAQAIAKLVTTVIEVANDVVHIVLSSISLAFAASGSLAMEGAIARGAAKDLDTGLNDMKTLIADPNFKTAIFEEMIKTTTAWRGSSLESNVVSEICTGVGEHFINSISTAKSASTTFNWPTPSAPTVAETVEACQGLKTENDKLRCAKEILDFINEFDPTGITGLVAAFIEPVCHVE